MTPVVDSTCLIYLAKAGKLSLLKEVYGKIIIPEAVHEEVVSKGRKKGFLDAEIVEKAVAEGLIDVRELSEAQRKEVKRLGELAQIGRGEAEAIVLAKSEGSPLIVDDSTALGVARVYGVETLRTTSLILKAVSQRILTKRDAREIVEKLVAAKYRLRGDVLLEILRELR